MILRLWAGRLLPLAFLVLLTDACTLDFESYLRADGGRDGDASGRLDAEAGMREGGIDALTDAADVSSSCGAGMHACGGQCVSDTAVDTCGSSCMPCATPTHGHATCDATRCGIVCDSGYHSCGAQCLANTSPASCGTSCTACPAPSNATATCDGTQCGSTCNTGFHTCSGACVANDSVTSCGASCMPCPSRPHASSACDGVACGITCNPGYGNCNGDATDGCETDLTQSGSCGACGMTCGGTSPLCSVLPGGGYGCTTGCVSPLTRCGSTCVDLTVDSNHCGSCTLTCSSVANGVSTCTAGGCGFSCSAGYHACGSNCVANSSVMSCGASCSACMPPPNATATCDGATCGFVCDSGFHLCGTTCVSNNAASSCGASCSPCPTPSNGTAVCVAGVCGAMCNTGYHACGGVCVSNTDPSMCGASCSACVPPAHGIATCDGTNCGFTCAGGYHACGGACVLNTDPATCGASCTPCASPANGSASCDGTSCGVTCNTGYHPCGGACLINTSTSGCGMSCTPCATPTNGSATCDGTSCGITCDAGFTAVGGACVASCTACDGAATPVSSSNFGRFPVIAAGSSAYTGSCGSTGGPESVFKVTLSSFSTDLFITTHASFDTVVYVRNGCCNGMELGCNDNYDASGLSALTLHALPAGTYYVFVDSAAGSGGAVDVDIYGRANTALAGDTCGNLDTSTYLRAGTINGTLCGYSQQYNTASCLTGGLSTTRDLVYWFRVDASTTATFSTCSGMTCSDTALYLRSVCNATTAAREVGCSDDACSNSSCAMPTSLQSTMTVGLGPGIYYLIVASRGTCGPFSLTATGIP